MNALIQPDAEGKFPTPLDGALFMASLGIPQTPLRPRTKVAFLLEFQKSATIDAAQIHKWAEENPDCNFGSVGREGEFFTFESDSTAVRDRFAATGGTFTSKLMVMSRPGRGHRWYRSTPEVTNIQQSFTKHQDFSVRAKNMYCVSPGSVHPDTGEQYRLVAAGAPDVPTSGEITFWESERAEKVEGKQEAPRNERGLVPHGAVHGYLLTQAGRLRQMGLGAEAIETALMELVYANCEQPIDDNKVRTMAKSICNFPPGENKSLILTGSTAQGAAVATAVAEAATAMPVKLHTAPYPEFPSWVMKGTSVYENFVKPYCDVNSRVDYFMWIPTAALMMNYLGTKVHVPLKGWKPSFYIILVGTRGKANKSSSIKDGMAFLEFAGVLDMYSKEIKNADGKTVVFEAGSPEGLGTDMQRINCKNAVLFYDELSALVAKNSIQGSSMPGTLLKLYDSNSFSNSIKAKKDTYAVKPDSYVASLVTSATTKNFAKLWGSLIRDSDGLDNRTTIVLQPETLPETTPQQVVPFQEAALATRKLIDRAVNQGTFQFFDQTPYLAFLKKYPDNRVQVRAEKWALYFAIDLGLTEIDEDCVERGIALAEYEIAVKKYLSTMESRSELAGLQQDIVRKLQYAGGKMPIYGRRSLRSAVNADAYDTWLWKRALDGLLVLGQIAVDNQSNPQVATLLRGFDNDEGDVVEDDHAA